MVYVPKFAIVEFVENQRFEMGVLYIFLWIFSSTLWALLERWITNTQTLNIATIKCSLQEKIYNKIINSNMLLFENEKNFNELTKAINYTETGADAIVDLSAKFLTAILTLIGVSYVIGEVNPYILLVALFIIVLSHYCMKKCNKIWFEYQQNERLPKVRFIHYISELFSDKKFVFEIKANNAFDFAQKLLLKNFIELTKEGIEKDKLKFKWNFISILLNNFQLLIFYIYFGYLMFCGAITFATYSSLFAALQQFSTNLYSILNLSIDLENKEEEASCYIEFLKNPLYLEGGEKQIKSYSKIKMKNVDFSYPAQKEKAISNLSIEINKGEKIALIGENGSGKTTFIKLLMGIYPPSKGNVFVDEIDLKKIEKTSWLNHIATVSQEPFLLPISIEKNIALSDFVNESLIKKAVSFVGMYEKIEELNKKEQTVFSKRFNKEGVDFSGGEKQKLVIARAIYKSSDFLIFDEPSSSLDPNAEYELFQKIYTLGQEKTVIFVSHRLSTAVRADRIIVFKDGSIVEMGKHEDLMKKKGFYAEMFEKQSKNYIKTNGEV